MAKQDDYVRYTIRVPSTVYDAVKEAAGDKSVNAEIIERLKLSQVPMETHVPAKVGRGAEQFMLRLPDGMRDQLKELAERSGRSMNAEIVTRLQSTFTHSLPSTEPNDAGDLANALHALADRIAKLGERA